MNKSLKVFIQYILKNYPKQFLVILALLLVEAFVLASSVVAIIPLADFLLDSELKNPSKITIMAVKFLAIFNLNPSYLIFSFIFILINFGQFRDLLKFNFYIYTTREI